MNPEFITDRFGPSPIVIGHRGAAGYRLENTLSSFSHAIDLGADFIEPDLVCTRDGFLVARHDNALALVEADSLVSSTTDVAERPEFQNRKTTKTVEGSAATGWFTEDFTLAELKTLRCREQYPQLRPENTAFDDQEAIPTLHEIVELVRRKSISAGRPVGIFIETKYPSYFNGIGLPYEKLLLDQLAESGASSGEPPVILESFEAPHLRRLSGSTPIPLVQLIGGSEDERPSAPSTEILSPAKLEAIGGYAIGISAEKELVIPRGPDQNLQQPTSIVHEAHAAGLAVFVWTFRNENYFLPPSLRRGDSESDPYYLRRHGDAAAELRAFLDLGVDGVFSDHPDAAAAVVGELRP